MMRSRWAFRNVSDPISNAPAPCSMTEANAWSSCSGALAPMTTSLRSSVFALGPTIFDPDVLPVFEPLLLEALKEGRDIKLILTDRRRAVHKPDQRHGRLLPRRSSARLAQRRPRERGKPECGDDIAPPHAIASPTRAHGCLK